MRIYLDLIEQEVPLVWFVAKENSAEICVCNNTNRVLESGDSGICDYVNFADSYRTKFGIGKRERFIFVTDNINVAKKTAYLFAGDVKNDYFLQDGELYYTKSELQGVLIAELDMYGGSLKGEDFPDFSYNLDGALFLGAEKEEDLKNSYNTILSCQLPFVSIIIDEKLFKSEAVTRLIFDYGFSYVDLRRLGVSLYEAKELVLKLEEARLEELNKGDLLEKITSPLTETEIKNLMEVRGSNFREEDLIRLVEMKNSKEIMEELHSNLLEEPETDLLDELIDEKD